MTQRGSVGLTNVSQMKIGVVVKRVHGLQLNVPSMRFVHDLQHISDVKH